MIFIIAHAKYKILHTKKSFIETMETAFCKSGYIYPIGDWVFLSHDYKAREKNTTFPIG